MNRKELFEIAKAWQAAGGLWFNGMKTLAPKQNPTSTNSWVVYSRKIDQLEATKFNRSGTHELPDLSDPVTAGCVLQDIIARNAGSEVGVYWAADGTISEVVIDDGTTPCGWSSLDQPRTFGVAALIAALERKKC
jgi:hypothetical protein